MVAWKDMLPKDSNIYSFIAFQKCPDFQNFANFFPKLVKLGIPEHESNDSNTLPTWVFT